MEQTINNVAVTPIILCICTASPLYLVLPCNSRHTRRCIIHSSCSTPRMHGSIRLQYHPGTCPVKRRKHRAHVHAPPPAVHAIARRSSLDCTRHRPACPSQALGPLRTSARCIHLAACIRSTIVGVLRREGRSTYIESYTWTGVARKYSSNLDCALVQWQCTREYIMNSIRLSYPAICSIHVPLTL